MSGADPRRWDRHYLSRHSPGLGMPEAEPMVRPTAASSPPSSRSAARSLGVPAEALTTPANCLRPLAAALGEKVV